MQTKVLVVSRCSKRRDTIGLIGGLLDALKELDKSKYQIDLFDTNFFEDIHNPSDYEVDNYFTLKKNIFDEIMRRLPKIRAKYADKKVIERFKQLVEANNYNIIVVHQVPHYADSIVSISHYFGAKVVFEPFGSDILRVSEKTKQRLKVAFAGVDGVVGRTKSNVMIAAQDVYNVPVDKLKCQRLCLSGVKVLKEMIGKYSRQELMEMIGIPYSNYNIVCGYSGRKTHRHKTIVESLIEVKNNLPEGYQIIFPMTYGAGAHHEIIIKYAKELKELCDVAGLNTVFLTSFLSKEQMAYLHLVTELFIDIQPADNGNAFLIEALFVKNQIVTGRWLNYKRFEQFGVPYYLIDTPEDLPQMLQKIFTKQVDKVEIPQELIDFIDIPEGYSKTNFWAGVFEDLSLIK